jgi:hypothetical protein
LPVNASASGLKLVGRGFERVEIAAADCDGGSQSGKSSSDGFADAAISARHQGYLAGQGASRLFAAISSMNPVHANSSFPRPRFLCHPHLSLQPGPGKAEAIFPTTENHLMKAQGKLSFFRKRQRKKLPARGQIFPARYGFRGKRIPCDTGEAFPIIRGIHGAAEFPPAPFCATYPETDSPGSTGTKSQELKFQ